MVIRSPKTALVVALFFAGTTAAGAQNIQNWMTNQTSQVQQDLSSGLINANQATQLAGREAQIQQQEQQWAAQNGGTLTPQQNQQIARELRGVNRGLGNDVRSNNPALNNMSGLQGYNPAAMGYYQNGFYRNSNFMYPPNMTGNGMYNGTYPINHNGAYGVNGYNNGFGWHHHHQWNGNN